MRKHIAIRIAFSTALFFLFAFVSIYFIFFSQNKFEGEKIVTISKGMRFVQVADSLKSIGVIKSKLLFELAGKILGYEKKIRAGKYLFQSGISNLEILNDIVLGRSALLISVTIPEGLRSKNQASLLSRELGIDSSKYINLIFNESFIESLNFDIKSLEGYLMPNTYQFYWQTEEEEIIKRLVNEFWRVYNDSLQLRTEIMGLSMRDVITMASIIEGETDLDSERATIAGVYYNRLRKNIPLQADPTIQYVIEDSPRRLSYNDLRIKSRYNTYLFQGLPPGPINNPGKASIIAALYPEKHNYLYFVASGSGGHIFSKTYSEHQAAVRNLKKLRQKLESNK